MRSLGLPAMDHVVVAGSPVGDDAVGVLLVEDAFVPRKVAGVLELDMEDEVVLYDADASLVHHLNPSATIVWHLSSGDASVEQLATEIADEYRLDPGVTGGQVRSTASELLVLGLVEDARDRGGREPDD